MKSKRIALTPLQKGVATILTVACLACPLCGQESEEKAKTEIEELSPDGRLGFLYSEKEADDEKAYDLVEKATGKVLARVAESRFDEGASSRFSIQSVVWKSDLSAFALTFRFWKRGTSVLVFKRTDSGYKEVELPELEAEIPQKLRQGKDLHHINTLDSATAMRWEKNGSLTVEIVNGLDGGTDSVTATRTVELSFAKGDKPKIVKSTVKYSTEN